MCKDKDPPVTAEIEGKFSFRLTLPVHFLRRVLAPLRTLTERIYEMVTGKPFRSLPPDDND